MKGIIVWREREDVDIEQVSMKIGEFLGSTGISHKLTDVFEMSAKEDKY